MNTSDNARQTIRFSAAECALGHIVVARTPVGVCAILLGDGADQLERDLERRFPGSSLLAYDAECASLARWVAAYIESPAESLDLPLDSHGTEFQLRVWSALREIPAGETASYGQIAERIGKPSATRAVASACGANPIAIAIPCHRVVRGDGSLSGYRWGVERKRALLERERQMAGRRD